MFVLLLQLSPSIRACKVQTKRISAAASNGEAFFDQCTTPGALLVHADTPEKDDCAP